MQRCLQLASLGMPLAKPNPFVGSVIVYNNTIIGEGYHQKCGEAHAEVNAIRSVVNLELLTNATLYVNLEPCAHYGKTPPCADLIIKQGIPKVVIGCIDPYSEVSGKGIERLKNAGIQVVTDVLKSESLWINRRFFTYHQRKRPYVILKWAQTTDGFTDKKRLGEQTGVNWITQPSTKQLVHKWRSEEDAIVVGHRTWNVDKPSLTVREMDGPSPQRIILSAGVEPLIPEPGQNELVFAGEPDELMNYCYEQKIQSVLIEGGSNTLNRFISTNLWDEARVLTGKIAFDEGIKAPSLGQSRLIEERKLPHGDQLSIYLRE